LDTNTAFSPQDIPPIILKNCRLPLAPSLCIIFNVSIRCKTVPLEWKKARVVPVFKKGDKSAVSNY
ncbi:hypothetical protein CAPTEDRAFT_113685, partial [Capitella teleta]